jgi:two-component system, NarL family, sensor kinase
MRNFRIFTKLFLSHILLGLVAILSLATVFYALLSDNLIQRTLNQLSSINILKEKSVKDYFFRSQQTLEALQVEHKFLNIYRALINNPDKFLTQSNDILDVENICKLYNFKNIHLFDLKHHQLFSTDSTLYSELLLEQIDSVISSEPSRLRIIDASSISPAKETRLFYYVPIFHNGQRLGVVLVEENFQKVQSILLETTGMGTTGESYIVGPDYTMRSSSRFFPNKAPGSIKVQTEAAKKSMAGLEGSEIIDDYRNVKVLSVFRPIANLDLNWVIISEIDWEEAMRPIIHLRYYLIGVTFFVVLFTTLITLFLSNALSKPILNLRKILLSLSKGIIPKSEMSHLPVAATDEIGQMAAAITQLTEGMERTSKFAQEIGSGNFSTSFVTLSDKDTLGLALINMRDALKAFNQREIKLVRMHASALLEGQENERKRIVAELHDGVGQLLTVIRMRVELFEGDAPLKEDIKKQINAAIAEVRRISYNVMPQALVDFGLEAALHGLCDTMKRYSNLNIDFRYVKECEHQLSFEISTALFRIAQEGLNNIVKYAEASEVNLHLIEKGDEIYMVLEDNGKGFDETKIKPNTGMGLYNIKQRATLLNGSSEINSKLGEGTVIEIHIPIPKG